MDTASIAAVTGQYTADDLLAHVSARIESTAIETEPFAHFVVDSVLPEDFYAAFTALIPGSEEFHGLTPGLAREQENTFVLDDRRFADLSPLHEEVFGKLCAAFRSVSRRVIEKFNPHLEPAFVDIFGTDGTANAQRLTIEHDPVASLFERNEHFKQPPHTDGHYRVASWIFYIPLNADSTLRGTELFRVTRKFADFNPVMNMFTRVPNNLELEPARMVDFRPNRIIAFINSPYSYHGVRAADAATSTKARRVYMLNWIEADRYALETIYSEALFGPAGSRHDATASVFATDRQLDLTALRFWPGVTPSDQRQIATLAPQWNYCAWLTIDRNALDPDANIVRVDLQVADGAVGVGLQYDGSDDFIAETSVAASASLITVYLALTADRRPVRVMFRNVQPGDRPSLFTLTGIATATRR